MPDSNPAVRAFNDFICINFTGPVPFEVTISSDSLVKLAVNHESPSSLTAAPQLLVEAIEGFEKLPEPLWLGRALLIQQSLLEHPAETLYYKLCGEIYSEANLEKYSSSEFLLEAARTHIYYGEFHTAEKLLKKAEQARGFVWALTGVLGKRTKYQQEDATQLVCLARSSEENEAADNSMPNVLELKSDLFLEQPRFSVKQLENLPFQLQGLDPNEQPALADFDTAILLLWAELKIQSSPLHDDAASEQVHAIVGRVLRSPKNTVNWSLYGRALWMRSMLEASSPHTMERGTLQMQSIVDEAGYLRTDDSDSDTPTTTERLKYFNELVPMPKWAMDTDLAQRYMALGAVKSAIEIYERLNLYADAAMCYAATGKVSKGLELLDYYLAENPNDARAWSIKGDITQDPQYWQKAWDVGKYAKAKRTMGKYYYSPPSGREDTRDLELAAECLNQSVSVNSLNFDSWFLLGCIQLERKQYREAATAFTYCVKLDNEDSKSWSNLAAAQLQLDNPENALNALEQAIRVDRNSDPNWKVWSNYITVAARLQEWHKVVEGLKFLLSAHATKQDRVIHPGILLDTVAAFTQTEFTDDPDQEAFVELFTKTLPNVITNDPSLWKLVAQVDEWRQRPWDALADYERAYRVAAGAPDLDVNAGAWKSYAGWAEQMAGAYEKYGDQPGRMDGSKVCADWRFKARSVIRGALSKGRDFQDTPEYEALGALKQKYST